MNNVERWAICYNNVVENICLWDGVEYSEENPTAWRPPAGAQMINIENIFCNIGWVWNGSEFTAPAEENPT